MDTIRGKYRGSLIGLAVGDALGGTLQFKPPGTFNPISDMVGGGPFRLKPGEWTDDTSIALCLAESLVHCRGFNAVDQMNRYVRWYKEGYLSCKGFCFDIGNATREALDDYLRTKDPYSGSTDPYKAGNGSIMRLAPVPLFYAEDPEQAVRYAALSSKTTHGAREAVDACKLFASLIIGAIQGRTKEELLSLDFSPAPDMWEKHPLSPAIEAILAGSYKRKNPPDIRGGGYVVHSLEAALWAFYHSHSFEDGVLKAVNLGDDADTTGAVYGQLAGAYYGFNAIPERWVKMLAMNDFILDLADQLFTLRFRGRN